MAFGGVGTAYRDKGWPEQTQYSCYNFNARPSTHDSESRFLSFGGVSALQLQEPIVTGARYSCLQE
jgi:hypothetical protein